MKGEKRIRLRPAGLRRDEKEEKWENDSHGGGGELLVAGSW